jgi:hypothetical protein
MRSITIILMLAALTGCANTEWLGTANNYGYRPEDRCIRCGEKWDMRNNNPFDAQNRRARGENW